MEQIRDFEEKEKKTKVVFLQPKTKSSKRDIPLPEFLINLLKKQYCKATNEFVISRNKKYIEPRSAQYHFNKLLKEANVEKTNFHALRHTFAVRALENGFDVKTLSEILGHKSVVVTLNHYAHSLIEHKRNSMERLEAVFNK